MIRFEILLPLFDNDGRAIEREKFVETDDELVRQFGATSTDSVESLQDRFPKLNPAAMQRA